MPGRGTEDAYSLSPMQLGMLLHSVYAPQSRVYVQQIVGHLQEPVDAEQFERAWLTVVGQQPLLRTWFSLREDPPVQHVQQHITVPIESHDWRSTNPGDRSARLEEFLRSDRRRGFDLDGQPLMRLTFITNGEDSFTFVWTFFHALLDGRSFPIVLRDVFDAYESLRQRQTPQPRSRRPYTDYVAWLGEQDWSSSESYWREELAGFVRPTPLVVDRLRKPSVDPQKDSHGSERISFSAEDTSAMRNMAEANGFTINTLVQGALSLLLSLYSGERDILIGATRACRHWSDQGADSMIGMFINTVPIRVRLSDDVPLNLWLQDMRATWLRLRDHEHTPLETIHGWSDVPPGQPLFESVLVFERASLATILDDTNRKFRYIGQTNYPLTLIAEEEPALSLEIVFDTSRLSRDAIERMLGHLEQLLRDMLSDPHRRLSDIQLLTSDERDRVLFQWNDTESLPATTASGCVHSDFLEPQAVQSPDSLAVVFGEQSLTYGELNHRANQLAHHLIGLGVESEVLVPVLMNRSLDLIVALWAVLKAGGAYVPLDPSHPPDRLALALQELDSPVLVTKEDVQSNLPQRHLTGAVWVDRQADVIARCDGGNPTGRVSSSNLACVIYTSGSTGRPKGVQLEHGSLANVVRSDHRVFQLGPGSRMLHFLPFTFDAGTHHMLLALCAGATLHLVDAHPTEFIQIMRELRITHAVFPPSTLAALPDTDLPDLKLLAVGGERCTASLVDRWAPGRRFLNMYGPTEGGFYTTVVECDVAQSDPSIGRPIINVLTYVLDQNLRPLPVGVPGELHISGSGVARGYVNAPELTEKQFVIDPFVDAVDARMYRTGDLCSWRPDGDLEFVGRLDDQIKLRGFRVEPGEIAAVICEQEDVDQCIVMKHDFGGAERLVAYLTCRDAENPPQNLDQTLARRLPGYMLPAAFVVLEFMPLTRHGKVDRDALPTPLQPSQSNGMVAARNDTERCLVAIWENCFGIRPIGIRESFFDLGGDSLTAVQLLGDIENGFGVPLAFATLVQERTVEGLANALLLKQPPICVAPLVPVSSGTTRSPLFCVFGAFFYYELAKNLAPDQPVYSLYLDTEVELASKRSLSLSRAQPQHLEDLAAEYVKRIRTIQPNGPYHVAGLSFGGLLAFEIAQQLTAAGEKVALLAAFDTALTNQPWLWLQSRLREFMRRGPKYVFDALYARLRSSSKLLGRAREGLRHKPLTQREKLEAELWQVRKRFCQNVMREYSPQPYPGKLTLFEAKDRRFASSRNEWEKLVGSLQVVEVGGTHLSMLADPNVETLARILRVCLDEAS